jgi:hypothetical protein
MHTHLSRQDADDPMRSWLNALRVFNGGCYTFLFVYLTLTYRLEILKSFFVHSLAAQVDFANGFRARIITECEVIRP